MKRLVAAAFVILCLTGPSQAITYDIFRSFDGATVSGTIETDGTLGMITEANVVAWQLDLTSPVSLFGGVGTAESVSSADPLTTALIGIAATASHLAMADLSARIVLQGASFNGWCMSAAPSCAFGAGGGTENLFFSSAIELAASGAVSNTEVFGTVAAVPLPASLSLLLAGFGALGLITRRRRTLRT